MSVTIVIPNYNGEKFIKPCMEALCKQTYQDFRVIFVDNGSTDRSIEIIETDYPHVDIVRLKKNFGFSRAVNEGIKRAFSDYVILLNNDTEVFEDYVEESVKAIEKSERIFSCSSMMLDMNHKDLIDDAGDIYSVFGWALARGRGKRAVHYKEPSRVFAACAGAAIYRRSLFERIGYFAEEHFAYLEDIDIGYRANIHGYVNMYAPKAKVYHYGSGFSGSRHNAFKVKLAARNSVYVHYKNMPIFMLLMNIPFIAVGRIIKILFFVRKGLGWTYIKGWYEGIRTLHKCEKVPFQCKNISNYIYIQVQLLIGLLKR